MPSIIDFAGDVFKNASTLPADIQKLADKLNDSLIKTGQSFDTTKKETATQIEQNLRKNKLMSLGSKAAGFFSNPINLFFGFIGIVGLILLIKKS